MYRLNFPKIVLTHFSVQFIEIAHRLTYEIISRYDDACNEK